MPTAAQIRRREKTNTNRKNPSQTIVPPGGYYLPTYGRKTIFVSGHAQAGNSPAPPSVAYYNPDTPGNVAGYNTASPGTAVYNPSIPGNAAGYNPPTPGNVAGSNPATPYGYSYTVVLNMYYGVSNGDTGTWSGYSQPSPTQQTVNNDNNAPHNTYLVNTSYSPASGVTPGNAYYNPSTPGTVKYNPSTPGNAVYNPPTGGTYAGTNNPSGGNVANYNPGSGGNLAGYNPTVPGNQSYNPPAPGQIIDTYITYSNGSPPSYSQYVSGYFTVGPYTYYNASQGAYGTVNVARPAGFYVPGNSYYNPSSGGNAVYNSYTPGNANYNPVVPGGAYYNPVVPGTAVYNPSVPGTANYNPTIPGNAVYNNYVAGTPGAGFTALGVDFPGGAIGSPAPAVSRTMTYVAETNTPIKIDLPPGSTLIIEET